MAGLLLQLPDELIIASNEVMEVPVEKINQFVDSPVYSLFHGCVLIVLSICFIAGILFVWQMLPRLCPPRNSA